MQLPWRNYIHATINITGLDRSYRLSVLFFVDRSVRKFVSIFYYACRLTILLPCVFPSFYYQTALLFFTFLTSHNAWSSLDPPRPSFVQYHDAQFAWGSYTGWRAQGTAHLQENHRPQVLRLQDGSARNQAHEEHGLPTHRQARTQGLARLRWILLPQVRPNTYRASLFARRTKGRQESIGRTYGKEISKIQRSKSEQTLLQSLLSLPNPMPFKLVPLLLLLS